MTTIPSSNPKLSDKYQKFAVEKKIRCDKLKSGYTTSKRAFEKVNICIFLVLFTISLLQALTVCTQTIDSLRRVQDTNQIYVQVVSMSGNDSRGGEGIGRGQVWATVGLAAFLGIVASDFFSGSVHFIADTYGTIHTPLLGSLIRSFREHHIDQMAITRHDIIESNGDNFMVGHILLLLCRLPIFTLWFYLPILPGFLTNYTCLFKGRVLQLTIAQIFLCTFSTSFSLMFALTNQFHKWSHSVQVPLFVEVLQRFGLILKRSDHMIHHTKPFDQYYCITTGWLNPILNQIKFWRGVEYVVHHITFGKLQPRVDDMKWTSHFDLLNDLDVEDDTHYKQKKQ